MLKDLLPFEFHLDTVMIAGSCLWSLALYLGFSPVREWLIEKLDRWLNFAERWLYTSSEEFIRTQRLREAQNAFFASILSIFPFLITGGLCNLGVEISLGRSWAVSFGMLATILCFVYELGRHHSQT
jgi:hypothetical protein